MNNKIELDYATVISSNITCIIEEMDLTKLPKSELLEKCEELGITKCKSKNKGELINLINHTIQSKKKVELIIEHDVIEQVDNNEKINYLLQDDNTTNEIITNNLEITPLGGTESAQSA